MRLALALIALLSFAPALAAQQETNPFRLKSGDMIRLRAPLPDDAVVTARVVDVGPLLLNFSIGDDERVYNRAFETIDTLDVRLSSPRYSARTGAIWGAYLGAATGLISGAFIAPKFTFSTGTSVGLFGGVGGLVGALTGAAIGAVVAPATWYRFIRGVCAGPCEP